MKVLLDTCDFLWLISGDSALPERTREAVQNPANEVFLSVVSFWEILVKHGRGKLQVEGSPLTFIPSQRELHQIRSLPLEEEAVKLVAGLPPIHRDPFDRMLICQALHHGLHFASSDPAIAQYSVPLL